ncbi:hypothetical protein BpHYR1_035702 [Brachionus plicatilis]|uniref:Uncharacterized protein n=1 Tax=Brachionus plicatilis TaxID=10195 RepID=A0A3M7Q2C6_BRAPC|nr:hypothetical protein BpHYR1_035702 [Brachionus plicatilis]
MLLKHIKSESSIKLDPKHINLYKFDIGVEFSHKNPFDFSFHVIYVLFTFSKKCICFSHILMTCHYLSNTGFHFDLFRLMGHVTIVENGIKMTIFTKFSVQFSFDRFVFLYINIYEKWNDMDKIERWRRDKS